MVARAAGAVCRNAEDDVHAWTRSALDITDLAACRRMINETSPDAVINCAAYTDVDGAESDERSAYAANAVGPENLAIACGEIRAHFVTISTDYVFDGENSGFYTEADAPNPQSIYARSKLAGEERAIAANSDAAVVRSGWIYGPHGTNFLSVMPGLLAAGRSITAIADQYGTPTYALDLATRLREVAERRITGVLHAANSGDGTSYYGFAKEVCRLGGFDTDLVMPVSYADLQRPATRPVSSKLASLTSNRFGLGPLPDWRDALTRFLKKE
jgi:dTDP-4-dehydrorhamnose reductase